MSLSIPNLLRRFADFMETPDYDENHWQEVPGAGKSIDRIVADVGLALHTIASRLGVNLMAPTEHSEPYDRDWLARMGFLPLGDVSNEEVAVEVQGGCEANKEFNHLIVMLGTRSTALECYDDHGRSLEVVDLGKRETKGEIRLLAKALGKELPR